MRFTVALEEVGNGKSYFKDRPRLSRVTAINRFGDLDLVELRGQRDYSQACKGAARGVWRYFHLVDGLYEVHELTSWSTVDDYYLFIDGSTRERCDRDKALGIANRMPVRWLRGSGVRAVPRRRGKRERRTLEVSVLEAARYRIATVFDAFERVYVSFSGGKDSSVMLHLVMDEAIKRDRKVGLLFIDLEAQYKMTIEHVADMFDRYKDHIEPYWISLPLSLRNAVSMYQPRWQCWDPDARSRWVREPPAMAIDDAAYFPFFRRAMEFEEFVDDFGHWYGGRQLTACFVGIRTSESLNRYRTIAGNKSMFEGYAWTTYKSQALYNAYPIYDWATEDIWRYNAKYRAPYNRLYDLMHQAGLTVHQQRICQPYGDDQRKGLWLYHVIEPETWGKVVARVNGANSGALYAQESGNILGRIKIDKPAGHTWESFARLLLESLPPRSREHFENKISVFIQWHKEHAYQPGIPDEADPKLEAEKKAPSWRRICKAILRNDYWCKGLSFTQTKSDAYEKYKQTMKKRRQRWGATW